MASDIRLSVDVFDHPKFIALQRMAGSAGVLSLIKLWCYAGKFHSNGILSKMSVNDIENACQWTGKRGHFVDILFQLKLLKKRNNFCIINDWNLHQPFVFNEKKRIKSAKKAINTRWQIHKKQEVKQGKKGYTDRIRPVYDSNQFRNTDSIPLILSTPSVDKRSSSIVNIPNMYKELTGKNLSDDDLNIIQTFDDDLIQSAFEKMRKYKGRTAAYLIKILNTIMADQNISEREAQIPDDKMLQNFMMTCSMYPSHYLVKDILKTYGEGKKSKQINSILKSIGYGENETVEEFIQRMKGAP